MGESSYVSRLVPVVVVLALIGCGGAAQNAPSSTGPAILVTDEMGHPHIGDPAPDFEVSTPEGERVTLSELRGKVVQISFVTSWCPFSKAEQPAVAQLAGEYAGRDDVRVLVVNLDAEDDGYRKYVDRVAMNAPVYWAPAGEGVLSYVPPGAMPTITKQRWRVLVTANLVIDREGRIRLFMLTDTRNFDAELKYVREALESALAESAG